MVKSTEYGSSHDCAKAAEMIAFARLASVTCQATTGSRHDNRGLGTDQALCSRGIRRSAFSRSTFLRSSPLKIEATPLEWSAAVRYGKSVP
jgi:hypothetical protein